MLSAGMNSGVLDHRGASLITLPEPIDRELLERSNEQGRSISNLAPLLMERTIASQQQVQQPPLGTPPLADQCPWPRPGSRWSAA
jgi:hypothetical protein